MNPMTFMCLKFGRMKNIHLQIWTLILLITLSLICAQQLGSTERPRNFPSNIELRRGRFINWARQYEVKNIWIASPATAQATERLANWAIRNGYYLRPVGAQHSWAPLVTTVDETRRTRTVLIDTTKYLTKMDLFDPYFVRVQAGATLLQLLTYLEQKGKGLVSTPAIGVITVGGMLAINAHGAGVPNKNEPSHLFPPWNYGSISNLVERVTFVGWDYRLNRFRLQTLRRIRDKNTTSLITNLGRIIITEVDIQVVDNYLLRCQSIINIPNSELFAKPETAGPETRTIQSFLTKSGRIETIQYPFTEHPWLKVWTRVIKKPFGSRLTTKPFNYVFTDRYPLILAKQPKKFITSDYGHYLTPAFTSAFLVITATALPKYKDLYGWSKNTMLYIKPTTMRYHEHSNVILTNDTYVQRILSDIVPYCNNLIKLFAKEGKFPVNGPIEIRVTSLDVDDDNSTNYVAPALSTLTPPEGTTHFQSAIWIGILSFPGTPHSTEFFSIWEQYLVDKFNNVPNTIGIVRPEYSKGWGLFHHNFGLGESKNGTKYAEAICTLNQFDPYGVFLNDFLERFFVAPWCMYNVGNLKQ